MQKQKFLFLDVDGVLHPLPLLNQMKNAPLFLPTCMQQLVRVIHTTGARIIVTSSWRCFEGTRNKLINALAQHGLEVDDCTSIPDTGDGRAGQILRYVQQHADKVGAWAVVDDEQVPQGSGLMMQVLAQQFVQTNPAVGLTENEANHLISLLDEESA